MENYNIYDEIGRGTYSFVYKARRKRSIEYVAVKSTAKCRMDKVLNEVQLLHKLHSPHVLKFYNWYESQNHIWLIVEYCIGGDLLNLITQDKQLPELAVQVFGYELMAGLQYLHSQGILFCDLKPANILIDEFGALKLADFGLARRIPTSDPATSSKHLAPGSPNYMAPELFQQSPIHSFASDFWALGCVMYELFTGHQPFTHTEFPELVRKIQHQRLQFPIPGFSMSLSFMDLLDRLLVKEPQKRITWPELINHPFWSGLDPIAHIAMPNQDPFNRVFSFGHESVLVTMHTKSEELNNTDALSILEYQHPSVDCRFDENDNDVTRGAIGLSDARNEVDINYKQHRQQNSENTSHITGIKFEDAQIHASMENDHPINVPRMDTLRRIEHESIGRGSVSARDDTPYKSSKKVPQNTPEVIPEDSKILDELNISRVVDSSNAASLILTPGDCLVKPIADNDELHLFDPPQFQASKLNIAVRTPEELLSCGTEALEEHLKQIYVTLKQPNMHLVDKLNMLAYLYSLSVHSKLSNVIVNSSMLLLLTKILNTAVQSPESSTDSLVEIVCLVLGMLFKCAIFISPPSPAHTNSLVKSLIAVAPKGRVRSDNIADFDVELGMISWIFKRMLL